MESNEGANRPVVRPDNILEFWFGTPQDESWGKNREAWWRKDPDFDGEVRTRFLATHEAAARGELESWTGTASGSLALLVLLDQFPRNMFRDDSRTYATDAKALAVAKAALDQGFEVGLTEIQRWFLYMPFQHSERVGYASPTGFGDTALTENLSAADQATIYLLRSMDLFLFGLVLMIFGFGVYNIFIAGPEKVRSAKTPSWMDVSHHGLLLHRVHVHRVQHSYQNLSSLSKIRFLP